MCSALMHASEDESHGTSQLYRDAPAYDTKLRCGHAAQRCHHRVSSKSINQSINLHFLSLGLIRGVKQTITAKILRMLSLNETGHSMLFYATSRNFAVKRLHLHAINRRRSPSTVHLTSCKSLCLAQHASCAQENICCSSLIEQISQIRT